MRKREGGGGKGEGREKGGEERKKGRKKGGEGRKKGGEGRKKGGEGRKRGKESYPHIPPVWYPGATDSQIMHPARRVLDCSTNPKLVCVLGLSTTTSRIP